MSLKNLPHLDLSGTPILIGDYIAYAAMFDGSPVLKYGVVTRLTYNFDEKPTVRVIAATRDYDRKWVQRDGKEVTLGHFDGLLVVDWERVPIQAREMLRRAYYTCTGRVRG